MNRRDSIVVAVLINAGVLIVLFTSALKSKNPEESLAQQTPAALPAIQELTLPKENEPIVAARDEVDQVIKQFSTPLQESVADAKTPSLPGADFTQDLNAFAADASKTEAVAGPVETPVESKGFVEVKVKKGDFLAKIAKRHHTTVDAIMKLNKLTSSNLKIGQVLKIPTTKMVATKPKAAAQSVEGAEYYTVRNGDSPWTIAVKNKIKVEDLLKLNNLDAEKAKKLKPGDQLRIK